MCGSDSILGIKINPLRTADEVSDTDDAVKASPSANDTHSPWTERRQYPMLKGMGRTVDILERFGQRVRDLRKARGFSQEAFAAECGLDRTYMGGIERGERNVALRNTERIARTLGISLSELMRGL